MFPPPHRMIREVAKSNIDTGQNLNTPTGRSQLKKASLSITMPSLVAFISSSRAQEIWNQMPLSRKALRSFNRSWRLLSRA
jgi:hypothetical protein